MICTECKKRFNKPLILFTGDRVCPSCQKSLFPEVTSPEVTEENHRLFTLSEDMFYMGYLLNTDERSSEDDRRRKLEDAIANCRESARLKNPYAMLKLGYYYTEGFIKDATADNYNRVAARKIYEQIVAANEFLLRDYIINGKTEAQYPFSAAEVDALKSEAKRRLAHLKEKESDAPAEESSIKRFLSTLHAMQEGEERAPLFAIFRIEKKALFDALADETYAKDPAKAELARQILNGTADATQANQNKRKVITDVSNRFAHVELGVRTNPTFDFKPLGNHSGAFKWEPFFGSTAAWTVVEFGQEVGYFYLMNASYKTRMLDMKGLITHLRKFASLYVSDEMMNRGDSCMFYADDYCHQYHLSGKPSYGKKDLSANLIKSYLENR